MVSSRAPPYRQSALISDFLDLAKLSIREEATLATNWTKHRPEWLKLQNLALATSTGPVFRSHRENMTAHVQDAVEKCESLGLGKQLMLHGNPSVIAQDFSPRMSVLRYSRALSEATLTSLLPAVSALLGYSSGKPVQDQLT